ncbi:MAG: tyrosine-type recombinase/integrase [Candidatus Omnitrophota bacterium]
MSYYIPTEKEMMEMLSKPDLDTVKGRRDRAILEVLYSTGLRRMEMHNLNLDDIDFTEGVVRVFQGKMRKDRVVPVGKVALKALMLYLTKSRPKWIKNTRERALFLERRGGYLYICIIK